MESVMHRRIRFLARFFSVKSPVASAAVYGLPSCPKCAALAGDPCRRPNGITTFPHRARLEPVAHDRRKFWRMFREHERELTRTYGESTGKRLSCAKAYKL